MCMRISPNYQRKTGDTEKCGPTVDLGMGSRPGQTPRRVASKKNHTASRMSWLAWFVSS